MSARVRNLRVYVRQRLQLFVSRQYQAGPPARPARFGEAVLHNCHRGGS
jgi:hypothetical protein